jgi:hypothetical protein
MKKTSPMNNGHGLLLFLLLVIIGMLIGLYIMILPRHQDMKNATQTIRNTLKKTLPFGGPYEQCEDMVCPEFDGKKECMHTKADDIMKCCQSVCHAKCVNLPEPALEECLGACTPLF